MAVTQEVATAGWPETLGRWTRLPFELFASGLDLFAQSLRGAQRLDTAPANHASRSTPGPYRAPPWSGPATEPPPAAAPRSATAEGTRDGTVPIRETQSRGIADGETSNRKETSMADKNLSDDMLKLVSYSIVCIERGHEKVLLCNDCKIFSDNMSDCDFDAWVIADYCEHHPVPCNKKYLRVAYEVQGRWAKPDLNYEQKQLDRLTGIQRAILECCDKGDLLPVERHHD